jgi:hypothetical protein
MTIPTNRDRLYFKDKDPAFVYRFVNTKERVMEQRVDEGWEPVHATSTLSPEVQKLVQQQTDNPDGGTTVRRGDVMLMRMPRQRFEETIQREKRAARTRQKVSADAMIAQANENAQRALRAANVARIPADLVFEEGPTGNIRRGDQSDPVEEDLTNGHTG